MNGQTNEHAHSGTVRQSGQGPPTLCTWEKEGEEALKSLLTTLTSESCLKSAKWQCVLSLAFYKDGVEGTAHDGALSQIQLLQEKLPTPTAVHFHIYLLKQTNKKNGPFYFQNHTYHYIPCGNVSAES